MFTSLSVEPGVLLVQPPIAVGGGGSTVGDGSGGGVGGWQRPGDQVGHAYLQHWWIQIYHPRARTSSSQAGSLFFSCSKLCYALKKKKNLLSFQKWYEASQSPGLQSFLYLSSPTTIYFLFHRSGCPSGSDTTLLLQVLARSGLICSGKNSGRIKGPRGNSSWIVFIFYHFILTSQPSPLPGSPPAMQPFINLKHGHPLLESVQIHRRNQFFAFHFSFKARKICSSGSKG